MRLHDIKVYQINLAFHELATDTTPEAKILSIVDNHRTATDNTRQLGQHLPEMLKDDIKYQFYIFNQIERESTWKRFLPAEIVGAEDFAVQTASFVLFAIFNNNVFAIIGGSGIMVIKRYLNHTFGLDLFEKIAEPAEDIINSLESRGITGNLSLQKDTYKHNHRLIDTLSFTRIPVRLSIEIRDVILSDIFDFLEIETEEKVFAEISNSFFIKCKMSFDEMHQLILRIDQILALRNYSPLSRYERIREDSIINTDLRLLLYTLIRDDMMRRIPPGSSPTAPRFDHDFVHPSKLEKFYECDTFKLFARGDRLPFYTTHDRTTLYEAGLRYLYENANASQGDFNFIISGIRVRGYIDHEEKTHAMFVHHLTCEVQYLAQPVFLIDDKWYRVRGDFIDAINQQCIDQIRTAYWSTNCMLSWPRTISDEGDYNLQFSQVPNFTVLDKRLGQYIELCDLMYEGEDGRIYLIHVKKGFDAKMRDLSNQITISASRLWNDIKSARYQFVDGVLESYNRDKAEDEKLSQETFRQKFNREIVYVMAFSSELSGNRRIQDNINSIQSNIAKFCLVQGMKEMQNNHFPLKIFEITNSL